MGVAFDWVQDEPREDDTVVDVDGVNVILDPGVMANIPYMNIDHAEDQWGPDYIINYFK